jgi:hypothetical protein
MMRPDPDDGTSPVWVIVTLILIFGCVAFMAGFLVARSW